MAGRPAAAADLRSACKSLGKTEIENCARNPQNPSAEVDVGCDAYLSYDDDRYYDILVRSHRKQRQKMGHGGRRGTSVKSVHDLPLIADREGYRGGLLSSVGRKRLIVRRPTAAGRRFSVKTRNIFFASKIRLPTTPTPVSSVPISRNWNCCFYTIARLSFRQRRFARCVGGCAK